MENLSLVTVRLPRQIVEKMDKEARNNGYFKRSDFIRAACQLLLVAHSNHRLYDDIFDLSRDDPKRTYNLESV